tara:strand:+ start:180 stop:1055 length:876 start_codon:yes stop_codon:yes gene_type:complete
MQTNLSELQAAAVALCDATAALHNATAFTAVALCRGLDTALVATVGGKSAPFVLSDYAFAPVKEGGKRDGKLRNAQFAAIMSQGFGESDEPSKVNAAVKAGFNRAFPAALYMAAHGGAAIADSIADIADDKLTLVNGDFHNVSLALAFGCYAKDGTLTENGKTVVERAIAMFSPERGPELTQEEAEAILLTKTASVNGAMNRRYGLKPVTVTELLKGMGEAADREGLIESKGSRAARVNTAKPSEAIAAFGTFLTKLIGTDGEAEIALNPEGVKALKALKSKLDAAIKAIA